MKNRMLLSLGLMVTAILVLGCHHRIMNAKEQKEAEEQILSIGVTVPDPAWKVTIQEVHVAQEHLLVVSSLTRDPEVMAPQVISRTRDEIRVEAPDMPVEHYVLGKTFGWADDPHHFIEDRKELEEKLKDARLLYQRQPEKR